MIEMSLPVALVVTLPPTLTAFAAFITATRSHKVARGTNLAVTNNHPLSPTLPERLDRIDSRLDRIETSSEARHSANERRLASLETVSVLQQSSVAALAAAVEKGRR